MGNGTLVTSTILSFFFFSVSGRVIFAHAAAAAASGGGGGSRPPYNAIFNFGDSMSDTGNLCPDGRPPNSDIFSIFSRLPYGVTYFRKPTCRCSDGRVVVDFLAQAFGLPLLPPSMAHGKDFRRGANMAIGGGTVLDYTVLEEATHDKNFNASMGAQIETFRRLLPSVCGATENCKDYIAKSLFVFQLGENDYNFALLNGSTVEESVNNVPNIVRGITSGLEELIALGAVDIVVSNIAMLGCFPMYLNIFVSSNKDDFDSYGCLRNQNALFNKHNSFLRTSISNLRKKHPHTRIMYADFAAHFYQMVQNPKKFGFVESALTSCCGDAAAPYRFNFFALCGMNGTSVCPNPWNHLIWDGMHLSDAANKRVADGWLYGPYCYPPILG